MQERTAGRSRPLRAKQAFQCSALSFPSPSLPPTSHTCALALLFADNAQLHSQLAKEELKEAEPTKHVAKLKGRAETKSRTNVKTETQANIQ